MTRFAFAALLALTGAAAAQDTPPDIDLTPLVASVGLTDTLTALEAEPASPGRDFALGGLRFLLAIEKTLQLRYRHNADFGDMDLPVLRLPLPDNPAAEPFYAALVADLFRDLVADMATAREDLRGATGEFGVTLDLTRLWFDINGNGAPDAGEGLLDAAGAALGQGLPQDLNALTVRFDSADAAWLEAYTHLLEGFGHLVLAFDPTEVIEEVNTSIAQMQALRGARSSDYYFWFTGQERFVDAFAVIYGAVNRQPDVAHVHAARDNLLAMVAANRRFWEMVPQETDNNAEWIPARGQVSALGITLPEDTADRWLAVLQDAEDVLLGKQLVGHWRLEGKGGVNVARLLQDPVPIDIVTWLHGHGLVRYMETGPVVDEGNLNRFAEMFRGDALLFMVWLN
ncbi:hypothetical protein [Maliponia aquimaris]|uniref:Uncharacterized protein n=1 Tax=Maliponia aquimaris TaxID=1673631 RepID=A0A238KWS8_9RHOB|nr:hypothetical protein [Maliponia aquimaris]SMX47239.1 hypothetical protein MAA8898_03609 [Maliponia aquimaris]